MLAALSAGALLGTLAAGQARARRPVMAASAAFGCEALCTAAIPYLGGTVAVAAALAVFGAMNGFGNVLTITAFQKWVPPGMIGKVTGLVLLASVGVFPVSVAAAALLTRDLGPAPFFAFAAAALAIAILAGLSQREWRDFGAG
jgi:hypothetical protein